MLAANHYSREAFDAVVYEQATTEHAATFHKALGELATRVVVDDAVLAPNLPPTYPPVYVEDESHPQKLIEVQLPKDAFATQALSHDLLPLFREFHTTDVGKIPVDRLPAALQLQARRKQALEPVKTLVTTPAKDRKPAKHRKDVFALTAIEPETDRERRAEKQLAHDLNELQNRRSMQVGQRRMTGNTGAHRSVWHSWRYRKELDSKDRAAYDKGLMSAAALDKSLSERRTFQGSTAISAHKRDGVRVPGNRLNRVLLNEAEDLEALGESILARNRAETSAITAKQASLEKKRTVLLGEAQDMAQAAKPWEDAIRGHRDVIGLSWRSGKARQEVVGTDPSGKLLVYTRDKKGNYLSSQAYTLTELYAVLSAVPEQQRL